MRDILPQLLHAVSAFPGLPECSVDVGQPRLHPCAGGSTWGSCRPCVRSRKPPTEPAANRSRHGSAFEAAKADRDADVAAATAAKALSVAAEDDRTAARKAFEKAANRLARFLGKKQPLPNA